MSPNLETEPHKEQKLSNSSDRNSAATPDLPAPTPAATGCRKSPRRTTEPSARYSNNPSVPWKPLPTIPRKRPGDASTRSRRMAPPKLPLSKDRDAPLPRLTNAPIPSSNTELSAKKSIDRSRTKKTTQDADAPPKRKRGRPPKSAKKDEDRINVDNPLTLIAEAAASNPLQVVVFSADPPIPKKKRGRPRKHPVVQEDEQEVVLTDTESESSHSSVPGKSVAPVKKKRGKSSKHPAAAGEAEGGTEGVPTARAPLKSDSLKPSPKQGEKVASRKRRRRPTMHMLDESLLGDESVSINDRGLEMLADLDNIVEELPAEAHVLSPKKHSAGASEHPFDPPELNRWQLPGMDLDVPKVSAPKKKRGRPRKYATPAEKSMSAFIPIDPAESATLHAQETADNPNNTSEHSRTTVRVVLFDDEMETGRRGTKGETPSAMKRPLMSSLSDEDSDDDDSGDYTSEYSAVDDQDRTPPRKNGIGARMEGLETEEAPVVDEIEVHPEVDPIYTSANEDVGGPNTSKNAEVPAEDPSVPPAIEEASVRLSEHSLPVDAEAPAPSTDGAPVKRKLGRPRKHPILPAAEVVVRTEMAVVDGAPVKPNAEQPHDHSLAAASVETGAPAPFKRKPGRPRKHPIEAASTEAIQTKHKTKPRRPLKKMMEDSTNDDLGHWRNGEQSAALSLEDRPPKRKRGRPPKNSEQIRNVDLAVSQGGPNPLKKKRGRPRKNPEMASTIERHSENFDREGLGDSRAPPKRGPGRPRKKRGRPPKKRLVTADDPGVLKMLLPPGASLLFDDVATNAERPHSLRRQFGKPAGRYSTDLEYDDVEPPKKRKRGRPPKNSLLPTMPTDEAYHRPILHPRMRRSTGFVAPFPSNTFHDDHHNLFNGFASPAARDPVRTASSGTQTVKMTRPRVPLDISTVTPSENSSNASGNRETGLQSAKGPDEKTGNPEGLEGEHAKDRQKPPSATKASAGGPDPASGGILRDPPIGPDDERAVAPSRTLMSETIDSGPSHTRTMDAKPTAEPTDAIRALSTSQNMTASTKETESHASRPGLTGNEAAPDGDANKNKSSITNQRDPDKASSIEGRRLGSSNVGRNVSPTVSSTDDSHNQVSLVPARCGQNTAATQAGQDKPKYTMVKMVTSDIASRLPLAFAFMNGGDEDVDIQVQREEMIKNQPIRIQIAEVVPQPVRKRPRKAALKEVYSGSPSEPLEGGWPVGWTTKHFQRHSVKLRTRRDRYWYSPETKKRFRSVAEVKRFLVELKKCGGDEEEAWKLFKATVP